MSVDLGRIVGLVVCVSVGAYLLWVSLKLVRTGDVSLVHDYNYGNVPTSKRPEFARQAGRRMLPMSMTCLLMPLVLWLPMEWLSVVAVAVVVAMLVEGILLCRVVMRYSGSLFS